MDALATPFGKRFLQWAFTILEEADTGRQKAVDAKSLLFGTLRIGVIPTVAPYLLPPVLASFLKLFPGVELVIRKESTERRLVGT